VAPVLLILAGGFLAGYPRMQVLGHLATMLCLGILLIEICLYGFQKVPFTCSYLPGKANLHFAFWACLMVFLRLLQEGAKFEGHALEDLVRCCVLICTLMAGAAGMRWFNRTRTGSTDGLLLEEEDEAVLVSLNLN
jgi:hypothetical protein